MSVILRFGSATNNLLTKFINLSEYLSSSGQITETYIIPILEEL